MKVEGEELMKKSTKMERVKRGEGQKEVRR